MVRCIDLILNLVPDVPEVRVQGGHPRIVPKRGKIQGRHHWSPRAAQHLVGKLFQFSSYVLSPFFDFRPQFFFSGVRSRGTRSACWGRMSWRLVQNTGTISVKIQLPNC